MLVWMTEESYKKVHQNDIPEPVNESREVLIWDAIQTIQRITIDGYYSSFTSKFPLQRHYSPQWTETASLNSISQLGYKYVAFPGSNGKRVRLKWSKFIKKFNGVWWNIPDDIIEVVSDYAAQYDALNNYEDAELKIVKGYDICDVYDEMYFDSCMFEKSHITQFYAENDNIGCLTLRQQSGDLVARALIWELDNGQLAMDRIYPSNGGAHINFLVNWADNKNIIRLENQTYGGLFNDNLHHRITVNSPSNGNIPYMDTMRFMDDIDSPTGKIYLQTKWAENVCVHIDGSTYHDQGGDYDYSSNRVLSWADGYDNEVLGDPKTDEVVTSGESYVEPASYDTGYFHSQPVLNGAQFWTNYIENVYGQAYERADQAQLFRNTSITNENVRNILGSLERSADDTEQE